MSTLTPKFFPAPISRASACLFTSEIFKNLPDGFIRIVWTLINKIDVAKPHKAIFANRSTLAAESGKSVETVQRTMKWLEEGGFIERVQIANPGQRGSRSPITLTEKFLTALGFGEDNAFKTDSVQKPPKTKTATTTCVSREVSATKQAESHGFFARVGAFTLPSDLVWLVAQNGMTGAGVLKLMSMARRAGKRLSIVVAATRANLERLKGRELFAYIKTLLAKDRDFGYEVRKQVETEEVSRKSQFLAEKAEILNGCEYSSRDGQTRYRVEDGVLVVIQDGRRSISPLTEKFLESIEAGRVRQRWITQ